MGNGMSFHLPRPDKMSLIIPMLQMREMKPSEVKQYVYRYGSRVGI